MMFALPFIIVIDVVFAILVLSKDLFQKQKPFIYLFSAVEDSNDVVCL